jgi:osmotically-inducible protein OsmY
MPRRFTKPTNLEKAIMKKVSWMPIVAAIVGAMTVTACTSSTRTTESTGQYLDSSAITSKVKAALLGDSGLKSFDISVDTFKDGVKLTGVVSSDQIKARAGEVARGVAGVRSVENDLIVK